LHLYSSIDERPSSVPSKPKIKKPPVTTKRNIEEDPPIEEELPHILLKTKVGAQFCKTHDAMHMSQPGSDNNHLHNHHHRPIGDQDPNIVHLKESIRTSFKVDYDPNINGDGTVHQLCIAKHSLHFHSISFELNNTLGDCDVFVSIGGDNESPNPNEWDWKSSDLGHDSLLIRTHTRDFAMYNEKLVHSSKPPPALSSQPGDRTLSELIQRASMLSQQDTLSYPLFFSISSKDPSLTCSCNIGVTVAALPFTEIAHSTGGLRGGQVMLPRDLRRPSAPRDD
jgi:hypothetical protein